MQKTEQLSISSNVSKQLITTIVNPLSELDKSLPERVIQYILHGDEIDVLADFEELCQKSANVDKIHALLRAPAAFYSSYNYQKIHPLQKARINLII